MMSTTLGQIAIFQEKKPLFLRSVTELLDVLDARIKTNTHFTIYILEHNYKHAVAKNVSSFKSENFVESLLGSKQDTACQILKSRRSRADLVVFFFFTITPLIL